MTAPEHNELSERELEILRLVATGASNKEIALQLFISANTVKVHLRNIFTKIGSASRTEAAMYAVRIGLVQGAPGQPPIEVTAAAVTTDETSLPSSASDAAPPRRTLPVWLIPGLIVIFLALAILAFTQGRNLIARFIETPAPPTATVVPRWRELAALPTPRGGLALVALENQLYAIGGESVQGVTGELDLYDIQTNTWTTLTPKPIAVADALAAVINGLIYIPGGRTGAETTQLTDQLEIYDPSQDMWSLGAPLPFPLSGYAALAFEGRLYLFGGWDGQRYLSNVLMYDPTLDTWQERSPMPTARAFSSAAEAGGIIYVIGGYNGSQPLDTNEVYSPIRDNGSSVAWETVHPLPQGRYGMGVTSVADLVYLIGGIGIEGEDLHPLEYSPGTENWQPFTMPLPESWTGMGMITLGPNLYMLGGQVQGLYTGLFLSYQAIYTVILPIVQ